MGKTNDSKVGKQKSLHQFPSMNSLKSRKSAKKLQRKNRRSLQKLFNHFKQNCELPEQNGDLTPNSSGFFIDTTPDDLTVTNLDTPKYHKPPKKYLLSDKKPQKRPIDAENDANDSVEVIDITKRKKLDSSCIIINDDEEKSSSKLDLETPSKLNTKIHSSTPLTNKKSPQTPNESNISLIPNNAETDHCNSPVNVTKKINRSSFFTIDLTSDTTGSKGNSTANTVIDLVNSSDNPECSFVSASNTSLSLSGESDVTVIENIKCNQNEDRMLRKFKKRIADLPTRQKGKILDFIAKEMFNGCDFDGSSMQIKQKKTCATDTAEDTYIKEIILGQTRSRNSIGSNVYNPLEDFKKKSGLRMIIIDGSNVAMEHGKGKMFSVTGLKICIDYFVKRGHTVKAFVPRFRVKYNKSTSPQLLQELANQGYVLFTPSREIQGRNIVSYDDRYIVQTAAESDGVIVSGDNFRDLHQENPRWRFVIENRLLPFTWVDNLLMFPRDPLGRNGPTLEAFLRHP